MPLAPFPEPGTSILSVATPDGSNFFLQFSTNIGWDGSGGLDAAIQIHNPDDDTWHPFSPATQTAADTIEGTSDSFIAAPDRAVVNSIPTHIMSNNGWDLSPV